MRGGAQRLAKKPGDCSACESHRTVEIRRSPALRATCLRIVGFIHSFSTDSVETDLAVNESQSARSRGRSCKRNTNLSPDQTSSTAQTLTSTKPSDKPSSRTTLSVRSVFTPDAFFGQETQSMPSGFNFAAVGENFAANSCLLLTNSKTKSSGCRELVELTVVADGRSSPCTKSAGGFTNAMLNPDLIPSFLIKGVPE